MARAPRSCEKSYARDCFRSRACTTPRSASSLRTGCLQTTRQTSGASRAVPALFVRSGVHRRACRCVTPRRSQARILHPFHCPIQPFRGHRRASAPLRSLRRLAATSLRDGLCLTACAVVGLGSDAQLAQLEEIQAAGQLGCFALTEKFAGVWPCAAHRVAQQTRVPSPLTSPPRVRDR